MFQDGIRLGSHAVNQHTSKRDYRASYHILTFTIFATETIFESKLLLILVEQKSTSEYIAERETGSDMTPKTMDMYVLVRIKERISLWFFRKKCDIRHLIAMTGASGVTVATLEADMADRFNTSWWNFCCNCLWAARLDTGEQIRPKDRSRRMLIPNILSPSSRISKGVQHKLIAVAQHARRLLR